MSAIWATQASREARLSLCVRGLVSVSSFRPGLRTPHPGLTTGLDSTKMPATAGPTLSMGRVGWQLPGAFALNWEGWISEWYHVFNLKTFQNFSMTFSLAVHFHYFEKKMIL